MGSNPVRTTMKKIIITPGSNGEKILKYLNSKKEEVRKKAEARLNRIREIGWDEYVKERVTQGAKFVESE